VSYSSTDCIAKKLRGNPGWDIARAINRIPRPYRSFDLSKNCSGLSTHEI
jgi:hypothetical protein